MTRCPVCGAQAAREHGAPRPFCSARCKQVDLHRWLTGQYFVAGEPVDAEPKQEDA